jgi:2-iminobutanoate/2-iminopropanoate deaminase
MKKIIFSQKAPKPIGAYSQAVKVGGLLFISGQLAIDPKHGTIDAKDIVGQTRQVIENIKTVVEAVDYCLSNIIQTTVYLSSMTLFEEFNNVYAKYFKADYPARAIIGCELKAGALVEISAIAYKE